MAKEKPKVLVKIDPRAVMPFEETERRFEDFFRNLFRQ